MTISPGSSTEPLHQRTWPANAPAAAPDHLAHADDPPPEFSASLAGLLYAVAAFVLEHWRAFVAAVLLGALLPFGLLTLKGPSYTATALFVPQASGEPDLAGLRGLAGQLGVNLRPGSAASPELYAALATSSMILSPILADTFSVSVDGVPTRGTLAQLFDVSDQPPVRQRELVLRILQAQVSASVNRRTGAIGLRVVTPWRVASLGVTTRILEELNEFNLSKRQSAARAERQFAEQRANEERARLRDAENALRDFVTANRSFGQSPRLQLEEERLQRTVSQRQQVLLALEQSYETARVREVQDTPVITVLQDPEALSIPDPRGRIKWAIVGMVLAVLFTAIALQLRRMLRGARTSPSPEARRFRAALASARRSLLGPFARQPEA